MNAIRLLRSLVAFLVGIIFISLVVETLELGLVTAVNGEVTTDPEIYYAIRNQGWFLALKLVYNTLAAVGGGYVAALVAGYGQLKHGLVLAALQTIAFLWGLTQPEISGFTPGWMWAALIVLSAAGIIFGARLRTQTETPV